VSNDANYPIAAPGWASIDTACATVHRGGLPHQFTSATAYELESPSPLPAICVWEASSPAAWHYVSYGLSELFEKSSPRADISGFGFELTFRLARAADEQLPPEWPLRLLQGIGHYVMSGHGELDTGHIIDLGGPLAPGTTALRGVVCVPDAQLGQVDTVHGSVLFLQLVGLCEDEIAAMDGWDLGRKVGLVGELAPAGITDPDRRSWREDPRRAATFRRYELKVMI
jgi:Suppressor of fused protein (SUFU)